MLARWSGTWLYWQLRGQCGNYGVYVVVTGSAWLFTGSAWLLRGLCGFYGVYVALTAQCGNYGVYVAFTGSVSLLRGLCGFYGVYVAFTGSVWLLRGLCGFYGVYVAFTGLPRTPRNCHVHHLIVRRPRNYHKISMTPFANIALRGFFRDGLTGMCDCGTNLRM